MAFGNRDDYEAWKAQRATGAEAPVVSAAPHVSSPGDVELRLSPLYAICFLAAGAVFVVMGLVPNKGGPTFHKLSLVGGLVSVAIGVLLYLTRGIVVRMTDQSLQIPGVVIPWRDIREVRRARAGRNYWVGIVLQTPRQDRGAIAQKIVALERAVGSQFADFDYAMLETDLPRSGQWFIDECHRRIASAGGTVGPSA
jgi:hypothetical protein